MEQKSNLQFTKPVVLVGMMGAGKTFIGRKLAARLGLPFYDSDAMVESNTRHSIPEIFERWGEAEFRRLEKAVILELLDRKPGVISTGGGAVTVPEILEAIQNKACSVWLKADARTLLTRAQQKGCRPLLSCDDPRAALETLLEQRAPLYARADLAVETKENSPQSVIDQIIKGLEELCRHKQASP